MLYLDRLEEAENTLQRASERKLEIPDFLCHAIRHRLLEGRQGGNGTGSWLWVRENPERKTGSPTSEAFVLAYSGHLQQARRMSRRAVDLAQQAGQRERAALYEAGAALREAFFGNAPEARRSAMAALELSKDRDVEYGAAFALALSGDSSRVSNTRE